MAIHKTDRQTDNVKDYLSPGELRSSLEKAGHGDARAARRWLEVEFGKLKSNIADISAETKEEYSEIFRDYGRSDLIIGLKTNPSLLKFEKENQIGDEMLWKQSAKNEIKDLNKLLSALQLCDPKASLQVIGWHESKSIKLPVVQIDLPTIGGRVFVRDNFYNFAVSVETAAPIPKLDTEDMDFSSLDSCYFEGFERSGAPVYGPHSNDKKTFSFHFWGKPEELPEILKRVFGSEAQNAD